MGRKLPDFFASAGLLALGILIGILLYQTFLPPKLVEKVYYEGENGTVTVTTRPFGFTETYNSKIPVLAVKSDDNTGVMSYANVEIRSGKGRVLINTNPFVEPDTQYSAETASKIAEKATGVSLQDRDIILTFESNTTLAGGPSAGGAITIAMIAAIGNKKINPEVAMTGTIEDDGSIGPVGGVLEKAQAASENGIKIFLVPKGSINLVYYERQVTQRQVGPFVLSQVNYVPKKLNLATYAMEQWKLEVLEVANISEAQKYFGV
jgi:predicted S18 family serine protease